MKSFFVDSDISIAKTIHSDFYKSEKALELVKEKIFAAGLQFAGDTDMLPENGSAFPITLLEGFLNEPLVVVKDKEGKISCMSNVCTHRGNLLVTAPCKLDNFRCKYHGRTFSLKGEMTFMPEFKEVKNFPCEDDHLHQVKLLQWGKLLLISLNPSINASDYIKDMMQRMEFFPMDQLKRRDDLSKDYYVDANWALYCENYLEGFHIPFVHNSLNQVLDFSDYETELFFPYSSLQLGVSKAKEGTFDLPSSSPDFGKNIAAYYFWVFPNMMFNFYPWGLSINILQPLSVDKTKVSFITYMYDESLRNVGAGVGLDRLEAEDEEIVQNVQQGIRSRFYKQGRYSVKREKGTHHFHTLLAKFINLNE